VKFYCYFISIQWSSIVIVSAYSEVLLLLYQHTVKFYCYFISIQWSSIVIVSAYSEVLLLIYQHTVKFYFYCISLSEVLLLLYQPTVKFYSYFISLSEVLLLLYQPKWSCTVIVSAYKPKNSLWSTLTFRYCAYIANSKTGVRFCELFQFRKGSHRR